MLKIFCFAIQLFWSWTQSNLPDGSVEPYQKCQIWLRLSIQSPLSHSCQNGAKHSFRTTITCLCCPKIWWSSVH